MRFANSLRDLGTSPFLELPRRFVIFYSLWLLHCVFIPPAVTKAPLFRYVVEIFTHLPHCEGVYPDIVKRHRRRCDVAVLLNPSSAT